MLQKSLLWMRTHERHLSGLAMVAGFAADSIFFARIDLWETQVVFASYTAICFIAIPLLHWFENRATSPESFRRIRFILPFLIQFALGGFWSGFVIFYWRSASVGASWPFLLFLLLVFLGNEYLSRYHSRLVFTSVLFFFALYSYAIFAVPIYVGTIGVGTFLISGAIAIGVFALFTMLLRRLARERFLTDVWRVRVGALCVLLAVNVSYFTNILPPLPLSAEAGGVYHAVWRVPGEYLASREKEPWRVRYLGFRPTLHVVYGDSLSAYSSVFAPTTLRTTIEHRWQWYDPAQEAWETVAVVSYPIVGGRDGGYRGYSSVPIRREGEWRVDVETIDGRLIDRIRFIATFETAPPVTNTITLD